MPFSSTTYPSPHRMVNETGGLLDAMVWALPRRAEAGRKRREAEADAWADEVTAAAEPFVVGDPRRP